MKSTIIVAVVSALTSGGFLAFLQFLISRHDRKQERAEDKESLAIKETLIKLEKDGIRTQLLLLILMKPGEQTEILRLAQHYFKVLKGNWYMTSIFKTWLKDQNIGDPDWFETD